MVELGSMLNNMPELPEVENVKRILESQIKHKTIENLVIYREKNIQNDISFFVSTLKGASITMMGRVGKYLVFYLSNNYVMIAHLRMEGKFYYFDKEINRETKHDIVRFNFNDGTFLIYNDTRKFGILKILPFKDFRNLSPLDKVGKEPSEINDTSYLYEIFKRKNLPIKEVIMDQSIIAGIGNIYADEILFECKIHPLTPTKLISKEKINEIVKVAKKILDNAIKAGGSTIKSYHPGLGIDGNFQVSLKVYGKKDERCPICGHRFDKIFIAGRGTTYCPHCQKLPSSPFVIGITGPIGSGKSTVSKYFINKGYRYFNADEIVSDFYKSKDVIKKMKQIIPTLKVKNNEIDRDYLRDYFLNNPKAKKEVEKYIHSLVSSYIENNIKSLNNKDRMVLEVPLLFESHLDRLCDISLYVDTPKEIRIERLNKRGVSTSKMLKINESFNEARNKGLATHVISNSNDESSLYKELDKISYLR